MKPEKRILSLLKKSRWNRGCLEFTGTLKDGYGAIVLADGTWTSAHRVSYALFRNSEWLFNPKNRWVFVMHSCDNKKCINPHHLSLGTHFDNMEDAYKKGKIDKKTWIGLLSTRKTKATYRKTIKSPV